MGLVPVDYPVLYCCLFVVLLFNVAHNRLAGAAGSLEGFAHSLICLGETLSLCAEASAGDIKTVRWSFSNQPISCGTDFSSTFKCAAPRDAYVVKVEIWSYPALSFLLPCNPWLICSLARRFLAEPAGCPKSKYLQFPEREVVE